MKKEIKNETELKVSQEPEKKESCFHRFTEGDSF
jgi:hypothetical protein